MLNIGSHLSISKGYLYAAKDAVNIGANTFQYFTRNPRGGKAKELNLKELEELGLYMEENNFAPILAHGAYTMNLCSKNEDTRKFAKDILKDDLERLAVIPNSLYVFHPGSHVGLGVDKGIDYIVEALNENVVKDNKVEILLETMSGKGTEIGRSFEEIKRIIDGVLYNEKIGVCLDTCHVYSAGYDIVNDLDLVIEEFDKIIGIDRLKAIHLNDSMMEISSNKDRHAKIGEGTIGIEAIINVINHPKLRDLPFYLETPNELDGHKEEIALLRKEYK